MNNVDLQLVEDELSLSQTQFDILLVIMDALNCWPIFAESCYDDVADFLWQDYNITVCDNLHVRCPEAFFWHLNFYFKRDFIFNIPIECF